MLRSGARRTRKAGRIMTCLYTKVYTELEYKGDTKFPSAVMAEKAAESGIRELLAAAFLQGMLDFPRMHRVANLPKFNLEQIEGLSIKVTMRIDYQDSRLPAVRSVEPLASELGWQKINSAR